MATGPTTRSQKIEGSSSLFEILINPEYNETLFEVSNGEQVHIFGSSGWIIATKTEVLRTGKGPARGTHIQAFRARRLWKTVNHATLPSTIHYVSWYHATKRNY